MTDNRPTLARVRELLDYDPLTGVFCWRASRGGQRAGDVAATLNATGYFDAMIDGRNCRLHQIAFLLMTGEWPTADVDHISGIRTDNRWCNLRQATRTQNNGNSKRPRNNTSGFKGVSLHKHSGLWRATINKNGKQRCVGYFKSPELAHTAYVDAAKATFGEFARAG